MEKEVSLLALVVWEMQINSDRFLARLDYQPLFETKTGLEKAAKNEPAVKLVGILLTDQVFAAMVIGTDRQTDR